ncbi:MAG: hypothetical protein ABI534_06055 [Chloroflexota bacterium]
MHRSRGRFVAPALLTALAILVMTALPAVAAVAPVSVSVTPYPNNASGSDPAFITSGELVGFDVVISNGNSTTSGVSFTGAVGESPNVVANATYVGTYVTGGSVATQTTCSQSGSLVCTIGNIPGGGTLTLRAVYQTPTLLTAEEKTQLTFTITGQGSGSTGSDKNNQSQGDTYSASSVVEVVHLFANDGARRGVAAFISGAGAFTRSTDPSGFGPSNPTVTEVKIPAFAAASEIPAGTALWFSEFIAAATECPAAACFGQTVDLHYFDGQVAPRPFQVTLTQDNVKSFVASPSKWTIYHVLDNLSVEKPFDRTCAFVNGLPTNAPCGVSRDKLSADKSDYVAVFWLTQNGRIWGG